jgi:cytochrome c biogenesis protein CcmG/thiol:disulfide interchange protein DsbE
VSVVPAEEHRLRPHALSAGAAALLVLVCASPLESSAATPATVATSPIGDHALDLAAYKGKIVYLDFWASWCGPCRQSFPWMQRMQQQYGRDGFVVVAVNVDQDRGDADRFLHEFMPNFQVVYDPQGHLAERYGVGAMPTSVLIDRAGQVRLLHAGFRTKDPDALEQQVRTLLATRS